MDQFFEALERYLRQFIIYIVSFFREHSDKALEAGESDNINGVIIFSAASAFVSSYIWYHLVIGQAPAAADGVLNELVERLLRWLTLAVALRLSATMFGSKVPMIDAVLVVFKVFPVALLVGIYLAYLSKGLLYVLDPHCYNPWISWFISVAVEFTFFCIFFPRELRNHTGDMANIPLRLTAIVGVLFLVFTVNELSGAIHNGASLTACTSTAEHPGSR